MGECIWSVLKGGFLQWLAQYSIRHTSLTSLWMDSTGRKKFCNLSTSNLPGSWIIAERTQKEEAVQWKQTIFVFSNIYFYANEYFAHIYVCLPHAWLKSMEVGRRLMCVDCDVPVASWGQKRIHWKSNNFSHLLR